MAATGMYFEQGPIRPPSEQHSLLIRVTRNCPWNRCTFCGLYKNTRFSRRAIADILQEIDVIHYFVQLCEAGEPPAKQLSSGERVAMQAAYHWVQAGKRSVFLQDSNSLILPPQDLLTVLTYLRERFPGIERITSYARSQTIDRMHSKDLQRLARAGLNRLHLGFESGSDRVLALVQKGATKAMHIRAGKKVRSAGIELSEYYMPGLGGMAYSHEHAMKSAEALNQINPHFIRLRPLAVTRNLELAKEVDQGIFRMLGDVEMAKELLFFLTELRFLGSIASDHILNLFADIDGAWPEEKDRCLQVVTTFLHLPLQEQMLYRIGRRIGVFRSLADCQHPTRRRHAEEAMQRFSVTPETVDMVCWQCMQHYI